MAAIFAMPQIRTIDIDHAGCLGIFAYAVYCVTASDNKEEAIAVAIP